MRKVPQSYNAEIYHSAILRVFTLRFSAVKFYSFETAYFHFILYPILHQYFTHQLAESPGRD